MDCKNNLSCTFLDLFLYIVDKRYINYMNKTKINPNTYLTITPVDSGKFLITFTQTQINLHKVFDLWHNKSPYEIPETPQYEGCTLQLLLEYSRDDKVHLIKKIYIYTETTSSVQLFRMFE